VHQKVPAVRGRMDFLDEEIVGANSAREREIQRALHLAAELLGLPFGLPAGRRVI